MANSNKKFYTDVQIKSGIIIDPATANTVPVLDASKKIVSSSVTATELANLSGSTSNIQQQLQDLQDEIAALPEPIIYKGVWDAATNTPALSNADTNVAGFLYYVSVAGTVDFGAGPISFDVGDKVVSTGTEWTKWDHTDQVTSVFGRQGAITAEAGDYAADQVTFAPTATVLSADVQAAIEEVDAKVIDAQDAIDAHLISTTAHAAEHITLSSTKLSATDVKAGLEELADDIAAIPAAYVTSVTDTSSVDLTVTAGALSATVLPAGVNHNALQNYEANDHIDHSQVEVIAGAGLTGGGDITASRTLSVDIAGQTALAEAPAAADEFLVYDASATALKKVSFADLLSGVPTGAPGDIEETAFAFSNNVSVATDITGLAFANASVRSFKAVVSVVVDASIDLYEHFELNGIQRGTDWAMSIESEGDDSGVMFSITSAGQVQYTSSDAAGFSAGTMKFRATVTNV